MNNYKAWMLGGFFAGILLAGINHYQDVKTPPKTIGSVTTNENYGHGLLLFGDKQPAKMKFMKIGHIERADGGTFQQVAAGVREHPPGLLYPTDEEFDLWLADPKADPYSMPLQKWLEEYRENN